MKKFIQLMIVCLAIFAGTVVVYAFEPSDVIYNNEKVLYDFDNNLWGESVVKPEKKLQKQIDDNIEQQDDIADINYVILTKKATSNVYGNSILTRDGKNVVLVLTSNYEVLKDGKLIAIDNNNLKYYQVVYLDGEFVQVPLTDAQLHEIFPKAQIVKISEFKDDVYTTTREIFQTKTLLLVNDTDRNFFKYTYKHPRVQVCDVKGLVKTNKYETIKFSHYGDNDGALTIVVKRK